MKILCGKQRRVVRRDLTIAYRHIQRAADLIKGAYGSHDLYQLIIKPVLRDLGSLVDMSNPVYGKWYASLGAIVPPSSRKLERMSLMTNRQLGLKAKGVEE